MAELDTTPTRYGLIMGDSILFDFFDQNEQLLNDFKSRFNLDVIRTAFKKGGNIRLLSHNIFPREMTEINNLNRGEDFLVDVFIVAGAVDISDAVSTDLDFDEVGFVNKRNMDLLSICEWDSVRHLSVFPLTPRQVCRNDLRLRFPKYSDKRWIDFINVCIRKINRYNCPWVSQKLSFVNPSIVRDIAYHVARDGIHLTTEGKFLLARSVLGVDEQTPPKHFWKEEILRDEFPPLRCDVKGNPLQPLDVALASLEAKRRESNAIRKTLMVNALLSRFFS